ncbi:hypothetical protein ETC03_09765 [Geobacillus sp. MMMUD3]|nr:hypothetical protein [Geobacillus sp. MMMUD3]
MTDTGTPIHVIQANTLFIFASSTFPFIFVAQSGIRLYDEEWRIYTETFEGQRDRPRGEPCRLVTGFLRRAHGRRFALCPGDENDRLPTGFPQKIRRAAFSLHPGLNITRQCGLFTKNRHNAALPLSFGSGNANDPQKRGLANAFRCFNRNRRHLRLVSRNAASIAGSFA